MQRVIVKRVKVLYMLLTSLTSVLHKYPAHMGAVKPVSRGINPCPDLRLHRYILRTLVCGMQVSPRDPFGQVWGAKPSGILSGKFGVPSHSRMLCNPKIVKEATGRGGQTGPRVPCVILGAF